VKAAQEAWFEASPDLDPGRLVFPDEPAAATSIGLVEERPLLRAAFSEAVIPLSATSSQRPIDFRTALI
jgi:hypothetical protein